MVVVPRVPREKGYGSADPQRYLTFHGKSQNPWLEAEGRGQRAEGRDKEKGEKLNRNCLCTSAASCADASCLLPSAVQFLIY